MTLRSVFFVIAIVGAAVACRGTGGNAKVEPSPTKTANDANVGINSGTCTVAKGASVSNLVDATWVDVDPGHSLIPIRLKLPPDLQGKLLPISDAQALYLVELALTKPGLDGVVQFGVDRIQSADDFVALMNEQGGTVDKQVSQGTLSNRQATEVCGTIEVSIPFAVVQTEDGGVREVPSHVEHDRYRGYFVPMGDHVFRASYRVPEKEAATWEPIFQAIISTVSWQ